MESRFQDELDEIQKNLDELNNLYTETKTHFDAIKSSNSRNTLSFIHLQTSNLISLNNARLSAIKDKFNIKKVEAELELKSKTSNMDGDQQRMLKELYDMISNDSSIVPTEDRDNEFEDEYEDYDIDSQLEKIASDFEQSGEISYNNELEEEGYGKIETRADEKVSREQETEEYDEQEQFSYEDEEYEDEHEDEEELQSQKVLIVVVLNGKKWSFAAINEQGEIVPDVELPDKKKYKMKLKKVDGQLIAYDQDKKIYRVIEK